MLERNTNVANGTDRVPSETPKVFPEWEYQDRPKYGLQQRARRVFSLLRQRFGFFAEHRFTNDRRFFGLSKAKFICTFAIISILLVALILGLAIGLSMSHRDTHRDLPLGSKTYTGDLTYYGPGLGACGQTSSNSDDIVSISHFIFDAISKGSDPNANPLCGHKIRASRQGKSVDLTVVDRCVGCEADDIDVSPGAFKKLADLDLGRVTVTWAWLSPIPSTE